MPEQAEQTVESVKRFPIYLLCTVAALACIAAIGGSSPTVAEAHQSGCHRWHSCPSDTGSYVCGDLGYDSYCGYSAPDTSPDSDPYDYSDPEDLTDQGLLDDLATASDRAQRARARIDRYTAARAKNQLKFTSVSTSLLPQLKRSKSAARRATRIERRYVRAANRTKKQVSMAKEEVTYKQAANRKRFGRHDAKVSGFTIFAVFGILMFGALSWLMTPGCPIPEWRRAHPYRFDLAVRWICGGLAVAALATLLVVGNGQYPPVQIAATVFALSSIAVVLIAIWWISEKQSGERFVEADLSKSVSNVLAGLSVLWFLGFGIAALQAEQPTTLASDARTVKMARVPMSAINSATPRISRLHSGLTDAQAKHRALSDSVNYKKSRIWELSDAIDREDSAIERAQASLNHWNKEKSEIEKRLDEFGG